MCVFSPWFPAETRGRREREGCVFREEREKRGSAGKEKKERKEKRKEKEKEKEKKKKKRRMKYFVLLLLMSINGQLIQLIAINTPR